MLSRKLFATSARRACCRQRPHVVVATTTMSFHSSTPLYQQSPPPSSDDKIEVLFQKILWLDMFEVHLLTELLNEKMGFGGLMGAVAAPSSASDDEDAAEKEEEAVEEKTLFDLKLTGFDAKSKIKVIKEVRSIAELGLKEAKELVEGAPKVIKKDIKKEEAEELQKKLEEVGATIEII